MGVRIHRRTHQLRVFGARGVDDKRDSQGYGAQLISASFRIARCRTWNNSKFWFSEAAKPAITSRGRWPRMVTALLWSNADGWAARAPGGLPAQQEPDLLRTGSVAHSPRRGIRSRDGCAARRYDARPTKKAPNGRRLHQMHAERF